MGVREDEDGFMMHTRRLGNSEQRSAYLTRGFGYNSTAQAKEWN
jgi:hypothetical protein